MRQKVAKRLRREAREKAKGHPERTLHKVYATGVLINHPTQSVRGVYRLLKSVVTRRVFK